MAELVGLTDNFSVSNGNVWFSGKIGSGNISINTLPKTGWHARWMDLAELVATWSKDKSRKIGCVIVNDRNVVVSLGWNGFPRGVIDQIDERHDRPAKYDWTEHAERNAIFNAASEGHKLRGCSIYTPLYPCAHCARAIIQTGIEHVYTYIPDFDDPTYGSEFKVTRQMFAEAGVVVIFVEGETLNRKEF